MCSVGYACEGLREFECGSGSEWEYEYECEIEYYKRFRVIVGVSVEVRVGASVYLRVSMGADVSVLSEVRYHVCDFAVVFIFGQLVRHTRWFPLALCRTALTAQGLCPTGIMHM